MNTDRSSILGRIEVDFVRWYPLPPQLQIPRFHGDTRNPAQISAAKGVIGKIFCRKELRAGIWVRRGAWEGNGTGGGGTVSKIMPKHGQVSQCRCGCV